MSDRRRTLFHLLVLLIAAAVVMGRQVATRGYFSCLINDTFTFTSWAWQFSEALRQGTAYPRWMALDFWGYGSPAFLLYPPLAYYGTATLNIFTGSVITAMNLLKFTAFFLSAVGMYFLVREFHPARTAALSAVFFMLLPFVVAEFYYFGTFASVVSLIWFAPVFLFTHRYLVQRRVRFLVLAGVCYGGMIATHLINAYMFGFVIAGYIVYRAVLDKRYASLATIPMLAMIGLLVSAAYVLPLLVERGFVTLSAFIGEGGGFHYADFFILPDRTSVQPVGRFWPVYYRDFFNNVLLFSVFSVAFALRSVRPPLGGSAARPKGANWFFLATAFCTLLLLFGPSRLMWETIPFFKYIQFPFRWLVITGFALGFASSSLFLSVEGEGRRGRSVLVAIIALIFIVCILYDYRYVATAPVFTESEVMPAGAVNSSREHLPVWAHADAAGNGPASKENAVILGGEGSVSVLRWRSSDRLFETQSPKPSTIRIRLFYFPGWTAFVDGREVPVRPEKESGALLLDLPAGIHTVKLAFHDTPIRHYANLITLASLLFAAVFIVRGRSN